MKASRHHFVNLAIETAFIQFWEERWSSSEPSEPSATDTNNNNQPCFSYFLCILIISVTEL